MMSYPGQGRALNQATYTGSSPALITYPTTTVLAAGQYSEPEPLNDSRETTVSITYDSAPAAITTIEYDLDPEFANASTLTTLPISADKIATLTITEMLSGFIRVNNTSTVQINLTQVQKQVIC